MGKPNDKFLDAFEDAMQADLAEGVGGTKDKRRHSTENLKKGFEIFLDYLDSNVSDEHEFTEAVKSFNKRFPMEKLFSEVMDMLRRGVKWATKDGKLSGPADGPGLDSKFNKQGFEKFLQFAPKSAKKFKGLPIDKKKLYLPEDSELLKEAESATAGMDNQQLAEIAYEAYEKYQDEFDADVDDGQFVPVGPSIQDCVEEVGDKHDLSEQEHMLLEEAVEEFNNRVNNPYHRPTRNEEVSEIIQRMKKLKTIRATADLVIKTEILDGSESDEEIKAISETFNFEDLDKIIEIQGSNGNWNYDAYMHGLYNGLILARDTIKNQDPGENLRDAPDKWLSEALNLLDGTETEKELEELAEHIAREL